MKRMVLTGIVIGMVILTVFFAWPKPGGIGAIMKMSASNATEAEMLSAVKNVSSYSLSADDVIKLKDAKVPNAVIIEMLHKSPGSTTAGAIPKTSSLE